MSKASEWAAAVDKKPRPHKISEGFRADVSADGSLIIQSERVAVNPTPGEALAFARWIFEMFAESDEAQP